MGLSKEEGVFPYLPRRFFMTVSRLQRIQTTIVSRPQKRIHAANLNERRMLHCSNGRGTSQQRLRAGIRKDL